jgi:hypothetical protein
MREREGFSKSRSRETEEGGRETEDGKEGTDKIRVRL